MLLHLKGTVNNKMVERLIEAINILRDKDNLVVYFTSPGGETDSAEAIIDILNKNISKVAVIFYGDIMSAAMNIFLRCVCPKEILKDTRGMYHFSYQDITIREGGRPSTQYDIFSMKEIKVIREKTLAFLADKGFTGREITNVSKGEDVYFSYDRMQQLLNGAK